MATLRSSIAWIGLFVCLGACGRADPPSPPAIPAIAVVPGLPPAQAVDPGAAVQAAAPSSVRTAATTVATGCPATDAGNSALAGTVHDAAVGGAETWTLAGSPHRLPDGLQVQDGAVLTIEPCARIIVTDGRAATVEEGGTLLAVGQPEHPIVFDSAATGDAHGVWPGVVFNSGAREASKLHYVTIEEAGGEDGYPGAIYAHDGFVLDVQHVRIVRSRRDGVFLNGTARFSVSSVDLVVAESGTAEQLSAPVHFYGANSVGSLPSGTYSGNATNEIVVEQREVTASATWRNPGAGVRYRLLEGLLVEAPTGPVLTVAPGTTLALAEGKTISVGWDADGALVLDGTSEATRIVVTSARPVPDVGDWAGIQFGEHVSRAATKLSFVTIDFAGATDGHEDVGCGEPAPAAIMINGRDLGPRIDHVTFRDLPPTSVAIARNFNASPPTDYTLATAANDFAGGQGCRQSLSRATDGSCPDPVPACRN